MTDTPRWIPFARGRLSNDFVAFNHLARLHHDIAACSEREIVVDMEHVNWFDAHLSAPLRVIVNHAHKSGRRIRIGRLQSRVRDVLCKNRLLIEKKDDNFGTTMPVQSFETHDAISFSNYARKNLDRKEVPKMSANLRSRFFEGIDELFQNSALHSKTVGPIVVSGQFFPKVNRLNFALADGGLGIKEVVNRATGNKFSAEKAIEWAMTANNTTRSGDVPGGLGSKILREFIEINRGRLYVVSGSGLWVQHGTRVALERLAFAFPGTFVILEIDTSDTRSYDLVAAPDPRDIW